MTHRRDHSSRFSAFSRIHIWLIWSMEHSSRGTLTIIEVRQIYTRSHHEATSTIQYYWTQTSSRTISSISIIFLHCLASMCDNSPTLARSIDFPVRLVRNTVFLAVPLYFMYFYFSLFQACTLARSYTRDGSLNCSGISAIALDRFWPAYRQKN